MFECNHERHYGVSQSSKSRARGRTAPWLFEFKTCRRTTAGLTSAPGCVRITQSPHARFIRLRLVWIREGAPHFSLFNSVHTFEYGTRCGTAACFSPAQRLRLNDRIVSPQLTETGFIEVVQARPVEIKQQQMTVVRVYKGRPHAALTVQYYVPSRTTTF